MLTEYAPGSTCRSQRSECGWENLTVLTTVDLRTANPLRRRFASREASRSSLPFVKYLRLLSAIRTTSLTRQMTLISKLDLASIQTDQSQKAANCCERLGLFMQPVGFKTICTTWIMDNVDVGIRTARDVGCSDNIICPCPHPPMCDEKPISILETRTRISFFQSHVRDETENFFLSIKCFKTRMRISFFNLRLPDENENRDWDNSHENFRELHLLLLYWLIFSKKGKSFFKFSLKNMYFFLENFE